ncbi:MAG: ATP-dependent protease subunit HslV [Sulfurihydrogenibium sp.]|jgi:ATP-dependent HslUV protease subunit HslV|uniref:ATP-dependent protease subunit HslV n=1 Tax=Sulfurihydrogenibium azorense TaxID=309806 RepID=A0A832DQU7_9AQUI|nr:MAG: HslU--HslV peptidase proteolytic subunit [Sulfurihydrogenibium sp.]PMP63730.1 MAG: HslU--HslV peptidase proteolytic subunit [Sulfurihydrogenibium sp.]PMP77616.1 MAG: HslU--HslV peptidase proteolytic subunit [Sulfurihydrogenibium sp.]HEV09484.1 ATP-dependent protease subunit HslV [Sulfurihydrogenibium azorense]
MIKTKSTTILVVRRNGKTVMAGDGQVTLGSSVMKQTAKKVRKLNDGKVIVGFAGSAADGLALMERLEEKLNKYRGNLVKSAVELAKDWRLDKYLRRLEAVMIAADKENILLLSGNGDVIEPDEPVLAVGSGGDYARSAALALYRNTDLDARKIVEEAMKIAGEICIYTNTNFVIEEIE